MNIEWLTGEQLCEARGMTQEACESYSDCCYFDPHSDRCWSIIGEELCYISAAYVGSGTCADCQQTCSTDWLNDGECDDGGPGSSYSECPLGHDCADCGVRDEALGGERCPVDPPQPPSPPSPPMLPPQKCEDTCGEVC